jgi:hypothetical protein
MRPIGFQDSALRHGHSTLSATATSNSMLSENGIRVYGPTPITYMHPCADLLCDTGFLPPSRPQSSRTHVDKGERTNYWLRRSATHKLFGGTPTIHLS